jgi:hypothetical protein
MPRIRIRDLPCLQLLEEALVLFVLADPKPDNVVPLQVAEDAIIIVDSRGINRPLPMHFLELEA